MKVKTLVDIEIPDEEFAKIRPHHETDVSAVSEILETQLPSGCDVIDIQIYPKK